MLRIVLILAIGSIISGLVAFLGNKLGRQVGRRKMSVFGLRPRHTSNLITVATGTLIFLITIGLAAAMSSEVRQFLKGIEQLEAQRRALVAEVEILAEKQAMGPIFNAGEPLSIGVVNGGLSEQDTREQIDTLLALANHNALVRNNARAKEASKPLLDENTRLVGCIPQDRMDLIRQISSLPKGTTELCEVVAASRPWYFGEHIGVQFGRAPNPRVFRKGEVITGKTINGAAPSDQVLADVKEFIMKDLQFAALARGMMRNPLTGKLDTSIDLPVAAQQGAQLQTLADQIARGNKPVVIRVLARKDIYPLGPLDTQLRWSPL